MINMHPPSFIVCIFCVTSGQNGENLGSDEEEIVLLAYLLYDVAANQVLDLQYHHVRPTHNEDGDSALSAILTEECKIQTGLSEEAIRNAMTLENVIGEFEKFLSKHQLHPDHGGTRPFVLCTDGQLHLRMCLVPEATFKNINLPPLFFRFFDLRREFKTFYKPEERPINCLGDMFEFLGLERSDSVIYGVKQCQAMATLLHRLICDGHVFSEPEFIKDKLEPGVCGKDELVDDETVVRARGLPWQSSDQDIARFFRGLNVERGGVALCLSPQGRRNGEALIRFESREHRDLALRKHKHHIGQRYIEVYKANGEDFIGVAGGSSSEAQEFLSRHSDGGCQIIVRMRGLPYVCKAEQVMEFFKQQPDPVDVLDGEDGVLFVHQADGRATGDAFVLFSSDEDAAKALSKHRLCIGTRYIELFKSTTAEVQQVLNRSLDPRANLTGSSPTECMDITLSSVTPILAIQPATSFLYPTQVASTSKRDCIVIKGLPYEAQVNDILTFLGDHSKHVVAQGVHLVYNPRGTPFGEALIQMDSDISAELACLGRNKKTMYTSCGKKNCLEVTQYSMDDISMLYNSSISAVVSPRMINTLVCNVSPQTQTLPILIPPNVPPPPIASGHSIVPLHRHLISQGVGQSFVNPGVDASLLTQTLYNTHQGNIYAFHQPPINQPPFNAPGMMQNAIQTMMPPQTSPCRGPVTIATTQTGPFALQPIVYWYPGNSVAPQSAFYVPTYQSTVGIKGLPVNVQPQDVLSFLEGQYEMAPSVQLLRGQDGRANGDAYVTFASKQEAERVIQTFHGKMFGNRMIEMFII